MTCAGISGVQGSQAHSENESTGGLQQQKSERFYLYRRERLHSLECRGTQKEVVLWVRLGIGFYSFFALPESRDVSQVQTEVSWEGEVSP
jgi:hypothetical protein